MFHWNRKKSNHQTEATNMSENPESRADISRRNGAKPGASKNPPSATNSTSRYLDHISHAETRFDRQHDRALRRLLSLHNRPQTDKAAA